MTKPSDFFIGVIDFFAVLLPGASLVYLLQPLIITGTPTLWLPATSTQGWVVFLVMAYIAGHLLHAIGSWLLDDYVYGKYYVPKFQSTHSEATKRINQARAKASLREANQAGALLGERKPSTLLERVYLTTEANPTGTNYYDWCLSDVRVHSLAGASEVDRLQADSKFFRSMVFVFLLVALISDREAHLWVSAGAAALTVFAMWRFCKLRWDATKRVYEYYLLLHDATQVTGNRSHTA